jgi:FRG domain
MTASFDLCFCGEIESVGALIAAASKVRQEGVKHKLWFRGHAKHEYKLEPTIARCQRYADREVFFNRFVEKELLNRFRRRAFPHDHHVTSAGYAIFLARHYGLPTRLLDWTANALFALYFSCIAHKDIDGDVWAFRQRDGNSGLDAFTLTERRTEAELFAITGDEPEIRIVFPVFNSPRLVAQDGCFTWASDPWQPLEGLAGKPFKECALDIEHLYRWKIPCGCKAQILRDLSGLGINHRSVYPDLEGIARSLWETEVLWNGNLSTHKPGQTN